MKKIIDELISNALEVYRLNPDRIRSDYKLENEAKKSYQGREILELIQNADDEMSELENDDEKVIRIELINDKLTVSNNGTPFSEEGVRSLMLAYNSDKEYRGKKRPIIGNKGTGFRAVLSWTDEITIHSGELHIAFSDEYSQMILNRLPNKITKNHIAPVLAFPKWIDKSFESEYLTEISLKVIPSSIKGIISQLKEIDGSILLFLNYTKKIIISIGDNEIIYKRVVKKNRTTIFTYENSKLINEQVWITDKETGVINDKEYSIVIAYCEKGDMPGKQVLYSFLPTDVTFPFGVLAHATFELDSTRNHLIKGSEDNNTIISKLAKMMVKVATKASKRGKIADYNSLKLIVPQADISASELIVFEFEKKLYDAMGTSYLLPTVTNTYISNNEHPVHYYSPISELLNGEGFDYLLKYTNDDILLRFFKSDKCPFNWYVYKTDFLIDAINRWARNREYSLTSVKENSRLIRLMLDENMKLEGLNIIYCSDHRFSAADNMVYVSKGKKEFKSPNFMRLRMIDPVMKIELLKELNDAGYNCDSDYLADLLEGCNISSFGLSEIIERINNIIDKTKKVDKDKAYNYVKDSIQWYWNYYEEIISSDDIPSVYLISRNGDLIKSDKLYLGEEYGCHISENLFVGFNKDVFVEKLPQIVEEDDLNKAIVLLEKLGVSEKPRYIKTKIRASKYQTNESEGKNFAVNFFWEEIKYPIKIEDYIMTRDSDKKEVNGYFCNIENIDWILNNSTTASILKWIDSDDELRKILESKVDGKSEVQVLIDKLITPRNLPENKTPSFICWKFREVPWIEVGDKRYKLSQCINEEIGSNISNVLVEPDISIYTEGISGSSKSIKDKYTKLLSDIGVYPDFKSIPSDLLYSVLGELEIVNNKELTKKVYRKIYDYNEENIVDSNARTMFAESGKVLCKDGKFHEADQCYYLDRRAYCKKINSIYNTIDFRTRLKSPKIQRIFCVKKLELKGELLDKPVLHILNSEFQNNIKQYKLYAYCYRYGNNQSKDNTDRNKFINLRIILCDSIKAKLNGIEIEYDNFDYITEDGITYYLKAPITYRNALDLLSHDMGDAVSGIICDILDLGDEKAAFRDLYMKKEIDRKRAVVDELEDDYIIEQASKDLMLYESNKEEFINILYEKAISKKKIIDKYAELIDFNNFNSRANAEFIIDCFKECRIDVSDYNESSVISNISLLDYYNDKVLMTKKRLLLKYRWQVYNNLMDKDVETKKTLVDLWFDYDYLLPEIDNSVYFNPQDETEKVCGVKITDPFKNEKELNDLYEKNRKKFEKKIKSKTKDYLEEFYSDNEITSLLYYGEFSVLEQLYDEIIASHVSIIEENDFEQATFDEIEDDIYEAYNVSTVPVDTKQTSYKDIKKSVGFKGESLSSQKSKEDIGYIGECKAYKWLTSMYDEVRWVSENAKKAKVSPVGSSSLGYDMMYTDNNQKDVYVEVKASSSDEISFYMSDFEFEFAKDHEDCYVVLFVTNALSEDAQIYRLDNLIRNGVFNDKEYGCTQLSCRLLYL